MTMDTISLAPDVQVRLKQALILESELLTLTAGSPKEALTDPPGAFRVRASLPVPRLLDPETAEMRLLEIRLRRQGDGWLVYEVGGL